MYTYLRVWTEPSRLSPYMSSVLFSSVDPIFRNISNNPYRIPYFLYFYACGKSTLKTIHYAEDMEIIYFVDFHMHFKVKIFYVHKMHAP